ncbi:hypothetical protein H6F67_09875 [Microcoleus sp. FACHB-1515]|uniref:hypothetical protein n=1 Tax=Cyanophyceae TaxID=3028117 RepID=UPI001684B995|nr:hypothetical protein [Microcoleus sp. FACHB-1515]MBD2090161.1 hypothetical protein [Microcoleus sp. FACHB-1515]
MRSPPRSFSTSAGCGDRPNHSIVPQPLPAWFRGWLTIVLMVGIALPIAALAYWVVWLGDRAITAVLVSYLAMLGLQILSESVALNRFHSCIWVTIPCVYLPYRIWQLHRGLSIAENSQVQLFFGIEIALWIFNYGVHLSQLPRLLAWPNQEQQ